MIYRRVTEVTEISQPTIPGLPNYWSQRPSFGRPGFHNKEPTMGPFLKRKRTMESWEELSLSEEVRSFKRVRILSNIRKARRTAFASWEDRISWHITESKRMSTVACDDRLTAKSTSTAEVDADFRNLRTESVILSGASFFPKDEEAPLGERFPPRIPKYEKHDTSGSKNTMPDSSKNARKLKRATDKYEKASHGSERDGHDPKRTSYDCGRLPRVQVDEGEGRLVELPETQRF